MLLEVLLSATVFLFWISISLTEGWKWRMDDNIDDNNSLITYKSYHFWRALTTFSWLSAVVLVAFINTEIKHVLINFVLSNVAAWILYERMMSFAQFDDFMRKKPKFHIFGIYIKRPPPIAEVIVGSTFFVILILNLFIF